MSDPIPAIILSPDDPLPIDLEPGTPVFRRVDESTLHELNGVPLSDGCLGQHWPESATCSEYQGA